MTFHIITSPQQDRLITSMIQELLTPAELAEPHAWDDVRKMLIRVVVERGLASVQASMRGLTLEKNLLTPVYPGADESGVDVPIRTVSL